MALGLAATAGGTSWAFVGGAALAGLGAAWTWTLRPAPARSAGSTS
jgi:hypothetical protein